MLKGLVIAAVASTLLSSLHGSCGAKPRAHRICKKGMVAIRQLGHPGFVRRGEAPQIECVPAPDLCLSIDVCSCITRHAYRCQKSVSTEAQCDCDNGMR